MDELINIGIRPNQTSPDVNVKRRKMRRARPVRGRLSEGTARPAAVDVPGVRLAARGPAHAPHGDDPLRLGVLRVRPDLHLALLRRAAHGGLRAVQLRDAGHRASCSRTSATRCTTMADPALYDAIVITNLCVPTASGVPLELLPKEINGVRIIGIDVPGFGVPTHAEAKDVLAGAMLRYARLEAEQGPVQRPRGGGQERPTVTLVGEMFPADPVGVGHAARAAGPRGGTVGADARVARAVRGARLRGGGRDPSVLHRVVSASSRPPAGRSSAPARWASTARTPGSRRSAMRPA